ncbi:MAG: C25 family cysteine peptidase [bacterium]
MSKKYCVILLLIPFFLFSGELSQTVSFSIQDLSIKEDNGYHTVRLEGCTPITTISEPELAMKPVLVLIPASAIVKSVDIIASEKATVMGNYNILPVQIPQPISTNGSKSFVEPNKIIYSSTQEYPGKLAEFTHIGTKGGFRIATIAVYPLQYTPKTGKLHLYTEITFQVVYEQGRVIPEVTWEKEHEHQKEAVRKIVVNPEYIDQWNPAVRECNRQMSINEGGRAFDDPEYAIMVDDAYASYFQPLKEWKTRKGVPTEIFLESWILANYSGATNEDRVRNFIIDYNQNHGTFYFLCGGDWGIFPMRAVNTVDDPSTPSDFWYADYDDDNYTEAYVGRASIGSAAEAATFVNKTLKYETETPTGCFHEKIFLPAYLLWSGYGCPVNDTIALYDPTSWLDAKRYDEIQPLSSQEISDSFNVGFGYTNIAAHGAWNQWGGTSYHTNANADALTNAPPLTGVITAICCNIGELDYSSDCYVEHMMNNPNGGSAAFWGNSRHGYGQIDNYGRSEWQCIWFYDELTNNDTYNIGRTVGATNDRCAPYVGDDYVIHCMNCCVLFGDPELCQYSYYPDVLTGAHNSVIPLGAGTFDVTVTDTRAPVQDAQVCLCCKTDTMYRVGYTNASGVVSFSTDPEIEGDTVFITVTKKDYIQYESHAIVILIGVNEWVNNNIHPFGLMPPQPNPAKDHLDITYTIARTQNIDLKMYNTAGQLVSTLVHGMKNAGKHDMSWHCHRTLPSGIYFLELTAEKESAVQKVIFIKD